MKRLRSVDPICWIEWRWVNVREACLLLARLNDTDSSESNATEWLPRDVTRLMRTIVVSLTFQRDLFFEHINTTRGYLLVFYDGAPTQPNCHGFDLSDGRSALVREIKARHDHILDDVAIYDLSCRVRRIGGEMGPTAVGSFAIDMDNDLIPLLDYAEQWQSVNNKHKYMIHVRYKIRNRFDPFKARWTD